MCQPTFPALFPKISAHFLQLCRSPSEWLAIFHIAVAYQKMHMCMCCICMHCKQYFISFWPEELPRKILCYFIKLKLNALKQLLYYVVGRSYSTLQYAELNGKTDRNVRGVRETAIKQIRKKYKTALETRLLHLPWTLTLDEKYFFENGVRTKDEKNSEKQWLCCLK